MPQRASKAVVDQVRLARHWHTGVVTVRQHGPLRLPSRASSSIATDKTASKTSSDNGKSSREITNATTSPQSSTSEQPISEDKDSAMTRRLNELADSNLSSGDSNATKAISESGFDPALKQTLLDRIASTSPRSSHPQAFASADLPVSAGAGSRLIASSEPWSGTENIHDSTLRMLDDSHKKIRVPNRIPVPSGTHAPPRKVDTGRPSKSKTSSSGARLANARDRSSRYAYLQDTSLSAQERDTLRSELKDRFSASARPMPTTLQGLSSLANERIEDAIARGQFRNIPRGPGKNIERDYAASSPFLDTTEYFMNKIIQKQEIVPPWIEKQQELSQAVERFRGGLRKSWRRHVARTVASWGGTLDVQVGRAEAFARAEAVVNPLAGARRIEDAPLAESELGLAGEGSGGVHMSQISQSGELSTNTSAPATTEEAIIADPAFKRMDPSPPASASASTPPSPPITDEDLTTTPTPAPASSATLPFRDQNWLTLETPYHTATLAALNALTRTYNLQAPPSARKPYYSLSRELLACYADVAPTIAGEIRERTIAPRARDIGMAGVRLGFEGGGVLGSGTGGHLEARGKAYGLRELWRDIFGGGKS